MEGAGYDDLGRGEGEEGDSQGAKVAPGYERGEGERVVQGGSRGAKAAPGYDLGPGEGERAVEGDAQDGVTGDAPFVSFREKRRCQI